MEIDFDLDEFLAYLLPGALLVILGHGVFGFGLASKNLDLKLPAPEVAAAVLALFAYLGLSLAAGHVASIWTRGVLQPLVRSMAGDPQSAIFGGSDRRFYTAHFRRLVSEKFEQVFRTPMGEMEAAAPLMIRAYVLKRSAAAITVRERVVRARSLCGNLTLPATLFVVVLLWFDQYWQAIVPLVIAAILAVKQHLLDQREYRSINSYFISA